MFIVRLPSCLCAERLQQLLPGLIEIECEVTEPARFGLPGEGGMLCTVGLALPFLHSAEHRLRRVEVNGLRRAEKGRAVEA